MAEYISKETLIDILNNKSEMALGTPKMVFASVAKMVEKLPSADVAEVKHGEWIYHECVSSYDGAISGYSCSVCSAFVNEEVFESYEVHKDFCGHCGAKMDGIPKENDKKKG